MNLWVAVTLALCAAASPRNVLYLVFDDLRPDLSFYGQPMSTPNLHKLADTGVVFERAFVQQAVCSPSRASFSTGRRPNSTRIWNFINHIRQAECETWNHLEVVGSAMPGGWASTDVRKGNWVATTTGGFAQCCTTCSVTSGCRGWTYRRGNCTLYASVTGHTPCSVDPGQSLDSCVSGSRGAYPRLTTLPQNFRDNGFLVLGSGKYFHDGCHNIGGNDPSHPGGPGMPPMADAALSWSNVSIQFPDQRDIIREWGSFHNAYGGPDDKESRNHVYLSADDEACDGNPSNDYCNPDVPLDGAGAHPPFCDFLTYRDALKKLRYAAENREKNKQGFFMVSGIRRPHLNWRAPAGYPALYPNVSLPKHLTLDPSIDPIAYTVFPMSAPGGEHPGDFVLNPYTSGTPTQLHELRKHYYAAISWADYVAGQILSELETLGLQNDTMVVMHSDHGWHLGEYGMWEKRSNWELGTRIPLLLRVPWMASARGRSRALVEAVDIYKTVCDVMGVPLPADDAVPVDGESLRSILEDPEHGTVKEVALSMHPRCRKPGMPIWGSRGQPHGQDNSCLDVERTDFTWMGYTMRTDRYRYTEYVEWNGTSLSPIWEALHSRELYDHLHDTGAWTDPNAFENVNLVAGADAKLLARLSAQLHSAFGFPSA